MSDERLPPEPRSISIPNLERAGLSPNEARFLAGYFADKDEATIIRMFNETAHVESPKPARQDEGLLSPAYDWAAERLPGLRSRAQEDQVEALRIPPPRIIPD